MLYGHVFRNAMLIVIAGFPALFVSVFFGGSLIIETIFSLDGLGRLGFEAAVQRDYPVIFGTLFAFGLLGLLIGHPVGPDVCLDRPAHRLREARLMALSPLNQRRWRNFKANRRAFWSLWIFPVLFGLSLFAEVLANDKPLLVQLQGRVLHAGPAASTPRRPSAAISRPRRTIATPRCSA